MAIDIQYILATIVIITFLLLTRHHYHVNIGSYSAQPNANRLKDDIKSLSLKNYFKMNLNQSAVMANILFESNEKDKSIQKISLELQQALVQIENLKSLNQNKRIIEATNSDSNSFPFSNNFKLAQEQNINIALNVPDTKLAALCEDRFGVTLIEKWKLSEQIWCDSSNSSHLQSRLRCFPYQQEHKKLDGRGADMFCVATNFFIDFSKVHGSNEASPEHKYPLGQQYYSFMTGSLFSSCSKTNKWKHSLFMPHNALQMDSFKANQAVPPDGTYIKENRPTYLLARDEDCENTFHHTADLMNIFLVLNVLGMSPRDSKLQMMYFDRQPDGPYKEFVGKVYAPTDGDVQRPRKYKNKMVLFREIVFHLESPAGLIFPKVTKPDPVRCFSTSLFQSYRKFALSALDLYDIPPPPIPSITLTLRHRTQHKNVGRVMSNENEVVQVLRKGTMVKVEVVDFAKLSFLDQIRTVRHTNVLVGIHGAGLMLIMFAAEEAVLVEVHPSYRQDRHFRHAARLSGKYYMGVRASVRESCQGSSDSITVPIDDFTKAVDGAVRLARTFDGGLVECGLICPSGILAMDNRLDKYYKKDKGEHKGVSIDTSFPCR